MKKATIISMIFLIIISISFYIFFQVIPSNYEKECKERTYPELVKISSSAEKSIIGIIPERDETNAISYNGIGSGVIFKKDNDIYYAITASHVVENENTKNKIFTINTKNTKETISYEDISIEVPDQEYYDSLLDSKIEYISKDTDLAIISFKSEEELPIIKFANKDLKINDKILAIGHPEGNRYFKSYGYITSNLKEITITTRTTGKQKTNKVVEHNAYINFGNSGGVVINKSNELAGINIAGSFTIFGYYKSALMIPISIVKDNINRWENQNI